MLAASVRTLSTPRVPPSNLSLKIVTNARDVTPYHYIAYPDLAIKEASDPVAEAWKNDDPAAIVALFMGTPRLWLLHISCGGPALMPSFLNCLYHRRILLYMNRLTIPIQNGL